MRPTRWIAAGLSVVFASACGDLADLFEELPDETRPVQGTPVCVTASEGGSPNIQLAIVSFPPASVVVSDIDVYGTLSGEDADFVTAIRIGIVTADATSPPPVTPLTASASETWTVAVPIELLLGANSGPGLVKLEAVTVDGCDVSARAQSAPFEVGFPPNVDAGVIDAP